MKLTGKWLEVGVFDSYLWLIRKCYPRKKSFWGHRTKSVQFNFLFLTRSGKIIPENIDLRFYAISSFLGQSPTKFNSNQLNSANPNLGFLTVLYLREIIFYTTPKREGSSSKPNNIKCKQKIKIKLNAASSHHSIYCQLSKLQKKCPGGGQI